MDNKGNSFILESKNYVSISKTKLCLISKRTLNHVSL
jgi:hypothetical protein